MLMRLLVFRSMCDDVCGLFFFFFYTQVLRGDLKPAIETHEMLYQVTKQHKFLPEVSRC